MGVSIRNQGQVNKAILCSKISNVTDPQLLSGTYFQPFDQIRPLLKRMVRVRGSDITFGASDQQLMLSQQLQKSVSADADVMGTKVILEQKQQLSGARFGQSLTNGADQLHNQRLLQLFVRLAPVVIIIGLPGFTKQGTKPFYSNAGMVHLHGFDCLVPNFFTRSTPSSLPAFSMSNSNASIFSCACCKSL